MVRTTMSAHTKSRGMSASSSGRLCPTCGAPMTSYRQTSRGSIYWRCNPCVGAKRKAEHRCRCGVCDWVVGPSGRRFCRRCNASAPRGATISKDDAVVQGKDDAVVQGKDDAVVREGAVPEGTVKEEIVPVTEGAVTTARGSWRKPTNACPTCHVRHWRRTQKNGRWFCEACRIAKCTVAAKEREARARDARAAALEAKRLTLPRWQQPIYRGDEQDRYIWQYFTLERLRMRMIADGRAVPMKAQGWDLGVRAGVLRNITERDRMFVMFHTYGAMLSRGEDVGDDERPPWWEPGKSPFRGIR